MMPIYDLAKPKRKRKRNKKGNKELEN